MVNFSDSYFASTAASADSTFHPLGVWIPGNTVNWPNPESGARDSNESCPKGSTHSPMHTSSRQPSAASAKPNYNTWGTPRSPAGFWRVDILPVPPRQIPYANIPSPPTSPPLSSQALPAFIPPHPTSLSSSRASSSPVQRPTAGRCKSLSPRPRSISPVRNGTKNETRSCSKLVAGLLLRRHSAPARARRRSSSAPSSTSPYIRSGLRTVSSADD